MKKTGVGSRSGGVVVIPAAVILLAAFGCSEAPKHSEAQQVPDKIVAPSIDSLKQAPAPQLPTTESRRLAPGTIRVRILDAIDSGVRLPSDAFIRGSIEEDVKGSDSQLAIPAGAKALVSPLHFSKDRDVSQIQLSLFSVDLGGRQYHLVGDGLNPAIATVTVDSDRTPENKSAHINEGAILDFVLQKPAELR